jgi:hypothetical protein
MKDKATWSSLLSASVRGFKISFGDARRRAIDSSSAGAHALLPAADEDLAALNALRGPAECRSLLSDIQPLMSKIGWELSRVPASVNAVAMARVFCLSAFSEAMSAPLALPSFDVEDRLNSLLAYQDSSARYKVTAILISFGFGRVDTLNWLPAEIDSPTASLIKHLADGLKSGSGSNVVEKAWSDYLQAFPQALHRETAEWRHLLLAARLAMGKLGGVPTGEVAEALHQRIKKLAAEESA